MDPPPVLEDPARRSIREDTERTASSTALPVDEPPSELRPVLFCGAAESLVAAAAGRTTRRGPDAVDAPMELPPEDAPTVLRGRLLVLGGGLFSCGGGGGDAAMLDAARRAARKAPREVATAAGGGDRCAAPARSRCALGERGALVKLGSTSARSHGCCTADCSVARSATSTVSRAEMNALASSDTRGVEGNAKLPAAMRWYVLAVSGSAALIASEGGRGGALPGEALLAMVGARSGSKGGKP